MALRLCLFLLVNVHLFRSTLTQQDVSMERVMEDLQPLVRIPDVVRSYPQMLGRYTEVVDFLLSILGKYVNANDLDRAEISDVEQTFEVSVKGLSYSTTLRAQKGWMEKLSTLTRVGNVTVTQYRPGLVSVRTSLSLTSLTVGFDNYSLPIGRIAKLAGKINVNIGKNKVLLKMLIAVEEETDSCSFFLEGVKVEELGDFRATITGLEPFNWLVGIIVDAILKNYNGALRTDLEAKYRWQARKFLRQVPCGDF